MKQETQSFYEAAVTRAVLEIQSHLDEALDLTSLARAAALSPLHFHRIFRGMIGETPLELHRRLRMERAAASLGNSDLAVTRIALEAGYETHESFTRAFGDYYGTSPSAFRHAAAEARSGCTRPPQIELASSAAILFGGHESNASTNIRFTRLKGETPMHVDFKDLPDLRVFAVHHVGPYSGISEAFARLGAIAGSAGLLQHPGTEMLAIYRDDPEATPAAALRSEAGLVVPVGAALPAGLTELRISKGKYACTLHVGPYTGLGDAWSAFMGRWLPKSGHRLGDGPTFEIYRNNPANTAPENLRTELYLPIAS